MPRNPPGPNVFLETFTRWRENRGPHLAAALAYYIIIAFAPLVLVILWILDFFVGSSNALHFLISQSNALLSDAGKQLIRTLIENNDIGGVSSVVSLLVLLGGASFLFAHIRHVFNIVWGVNEKGVKSTLRDGILGIAMIFIIASILLTAQMLILASVKLAWIFPFLAKFTWVSQVIFYLASILLFCSMYRILPSARVRWSKAFQGGLLTASLFYLGQALLSIYFKYTVLGSLYGAASSFVLFLLYIFYSAQIFYFGAEFTHVISKY